MALLRIRTFPDPVLREEAAPVDEVTEAVRKLSRDMVETMRLARGAGLAANQVGVPIRLIVLEGDLEERKDGEPLVILNPCIVEKGEEEVSEEGCLSFPKFFEYVKRSKKVVVRGETLDKKPFQRDCEGILARAFQHEIDHLNGVLFIDHLSPVKKDLFKKRYLKADKTDR
jgi:peptide deformylase